MAKDKSGKKKKSFGQKILDFGKKVVTAPITIPAKILGATGKAAVQGVLGKKGGNEFLNGTEDQYGQVPLYTPEQQALLNKVLENALATATPNTNQQPANGIAAPLPNTEATNGLNQLSPQQSQNTLNMGDLSGIGTILANLGPISGSLNGINAQAPQTFAPQQPQQPLSFWDQFQNNAAQQLAGQNQGGFNLGGATGQNQGGGFWDALQGLGTSAASAYGGPVGGLLAQGLGSGLRWLFSGNGNQQQQFNPGNYASALNELGGLPQNQFNFAPIKQQALSNFEQEIIPTIAARFSGLGTGGSQRSSGFTQALGQAGAGLAQNLASLEQQYGLQNFAQNQQARQAQQNAALNLLGGNRAYGNQQQQFGLQQQQIGQHQQQIGQSQQNINLQNILAQAQLGQAQQQMAQNQLQNQQQFGLQNQQVGLSQQHQNLNALNSLAGIGQNQQANNLNALLGQGNLQQNQQRINLANLANQQGNNQALLQLALTPQNQNTFNPGKPGAISQLLSGVGNAIPTAAKAYFGGGL